MTGAEYKNRAYFESKPNSKGASLENIARGFKDGEMKTHRDHWETHAISYAPIRQLSFASVKSDLKATGDFVLIRQRDQVFLEGNMVHDWKDAYDWHQDLSFYVPPFGTISDADALLLQKHRGAKHFSMRSRRHQKWRGTFSLTTGFFEWSS